MVQDSNTESLFDRKLDFFSDFTVRGYEYYYFPGNFLSCVGNTFSFKVSDVKLHSLPGFLPDEFSKTYSIIYFDVFTDIAYVNSYANLQGLYNPLNENFLYSIGVGLTLETYYDRLFQIHMVYNGYFSKFGIFAEYKTPIYKTF